MILMFMSRRQRYDWRLILLCLLHATRASLIGWPILALDILQFPFDHPGLAFRVGQDIRQGEDTSPISGSSTRPMSHDVVVHKIKIY